MTLPRPLVNVVQSSPRPLSLNGTVAPAVPWNALAASWWCRWCSRRPFANTGDHWRWTKTVLGGSHLRQFRNGQKFWTLNLLTSASRLDTYWTPISFKVNINIFFSVMGPLRLARKCAVWAASTNEDWIFLHLPQHGQPAISIHCRATKGTHLKLLNTAAKTLSSCVRCLRTIQKEFLFARSVLHPS